MPFGSYAILVMTARHSVEVGFRSLHHLPPSKHQSYAACRWPKRFPTKPMVHRAHSRLSRRSPSLVITTRVPRGPDRTQPEWWRGHAVSRKRWLSRSSVARPHIDRFNIFRRLIWPPTGPVLQGRIRPASTAS